MAMSKKKGERDPLASEFDDVLPVHTESELEDFGTWLDRYSVERSLPIMFSKNKSPFEDVLAAVMDEFNDDSVKPIKKRETVMVVDMEAAMRGFGAMSKRGVIMEYKNGKQQAWKYQLFWNKYDQWLKAKGRKDFIEAAKMRDLVKMAAENMEFHSDIPDPAPEELVVTDF